MLVFPVSVTNKFIQAHRLPEMRALYQDYIAMYRAAGLPSANHTFNHFGSTGLPRFTLQFPLCVWIDVRE